MTGSLRIVYIAFCLTIAIRGLAAGVRSRAADFLRRREDPSGDDHQQSLRPVQQLMSLSGQRNSARNRAWARRFRRLSSPASVAYAGLRPRPSPLGNAHFQTLLSLRRHGWFRRKGKILGRFGRHILRVNDDRHHLIVGPTRSGKGACYVIPNAFTHEGSMIVTDLKGEIFRSTAGYRKSKGNQVFLFAPGSDRTHRYNPLDFIRPDRGDRTTDIQNIAAILVPESHRVREFDLAGNRPAGHGGRDQLHQ